MTRAGASGSVGTKMSECTRSSGAPVFPQVFSGRYTTKHQLIRAPLYSQGSLLGDGPTSNRLIQSAPPLGCPQSFAKPLGGVNNLGLLSSAAALRTAQGRPGTSGTQDPGGREGGGKTTGKGQAFLGEGRPESVRSTQMERQVNCSHRNREAGW